jgi:hydrogenase/urease accessory protein HupE
MEASFLSHAASALAHSSIQGLDEFQNGFLHPLMTPVHLLVLVTFGLWLSRRRPFAPAREVGTFAASSALAFGAVLMFPKLEMPLLPVMLTAVAGASVIASGAREQAAVRYVGFALAGALLGLDSAPDFFWITRWNAFKTVAGSWFGLQIGILWVGYYSSLLPDRKWATYGVRIIASWVIAIAVMMIAFLFRRA